MKDHPLAFVGFRMLPGSESLILGGHFNLPKKDNCQVLHIPQVCPSLEWLWLFVWREHRTRRVVIISHSAERCEEEVRGSEGNPPGNDLCLAFGGMRASHLWVFYKQGAPDLLTPHLPLTLSGSSENPLPHLCPLKISLPSSLFLSNPWLQLWWQSRVARIVTGKKVDKRRIGK